MRRLYLLICICFLFLLGCEFIDEVILEKEPAVEPEKVIEKEVEKEPENDTQTCTAESKCINSSKFYQLENCSLVNETECEYGCQDGACLSPPANETEEKKEIEENKTEEKTEGPAEKEISKGENYIQAGETHVLADGNKTHKISIYTLQPGQVRFRINKDKTDWYSEGQNFTSYGFTFDIKEILFQSYGIKAVTYEIK